MKLSNILLSLVCTVGLVNYSNFMNAMEGPRKHHTKHIMSSSEAIKIAKDIAEKILSEHMEALESAKLLTELDLQRQKEDIPLDAGIIVDASLPRAINTIIEKLKEVADY